jgi:hypothetical protein
MTFLTASLSEEWGRMIWSMHPGAPTETLLQNDSPFKIRETGQSPLLSLKKCILDFIPDIIHYWETSIFFCNFTMVTMMGILSVIGSIKLATLPLSFINKIEILFPSRLCPYLIASSRPETLYFRCPPKVRFSRTFSRVWLITRFWNIFTVLTGTVRRLV